MRTLWPYKRWGFPQRTTTTSPPIATIPPPSPSQSTHHDVRAQGFPTHKSSTVAPQGSSTVVVVSLFLLYMARGFPLGFQTKILPVVLRRQGVSLELVGYTGLMTLPWSLKFAFAPFLDLRVHRGAPTPTSQAAARWTRTRLIALQVAITALLLCNAYLVDWWQEDTDSAWAFRGLLAVTLLTNCLSAVQDLFVDSLVLQAVTDGYLSSAGNSISIGAVKMGTFFAGGAFFAVTQYESVTSVYFITLAVLTACTSLYFSYASCSGNDAASQAAKGRSIVNVGVIDVDDSDSAGDNAGASASASASDSDHDMSDRHPAGTSASRQPGRVWRLLRATYEHRQVFWCTVFVATYKLGECLSDSLWKPFLVDVGFDMAGVGFWAGTVGMLFSLCGTAVGSALGMRLTVRGCLNLLGLLRCLAVAGRVVCAMPWMQTHIHALAAGGGSGVGALVAAFDGVGSAQSAWTFAFLFALIAFESVVGAAMTSCMYVFILDSVTRMGPRFGVNMNFHYSALSALEVLSKSVFFSSAGKVGDLIGYLNTFVLSLLLSAAFLVLHWWCHAADFPIYRSKSQTVEQKRR